MAGGCSVRVGGVWRAIVVGGHGVSCNNNNFRRCYPHPTHVHTENISRSGLFDMFYGRKWSIPGVRIFGWHDVKIFRGATIFGWPDKPGGEDI